MDGSKRKGNYIDILGQKSRNDENFSMSTVDGLNQISGSYPTKGSSLQIPRLRIPFLFFLGLFNESTVT